MIGGLLVFAAMATAPLPPLSAGTIRLEIIAAPTAAYQMLCHIRTYKTAEARLVNSYGVDNKGAFHDVIPSPLAECQIKKTAGPGPLTVRLSKPGALKSATIDAVGPSGQTSLNIF